MADQIPQKIHFVWIGNPIPDRQVSCILTWALKNQGYEVVLWTNRCRENLARFETVAKLFPSLMEFSRSLDTDRHAAGVLGNKAARRFSELKLESIDNLTATLGPALSERYDEEVAASNFGGGSDILRIGLLQKEGGIYLDTDSDCLQSLPNQLTAPDGILFGTYKVNGHSTFCNAVIAAPQGHKLLDEIAAAMTTDYEMWEREGLLAKYRQGVELARAKVNAARVGTVADLRNARTAFQQEMQSGTLLITGPTQIALWLYLHVGGSETPLNWTRTQMKAPTYMPRNHLQMAEMYSTFQMMVVKPRLCEPAVESRYSFPAGYVGINSEASWIK